MRDDGQDHDADRHAEQAVEAEPVEAGVAELRLAAEIVVGEAVGHQQRDAARPRTCTPSVATKAGTLKRAISTPLTRPIKAPSAQAEHRDDPDRRVEDDAEPAQRARPASGSRRRTPREPERRADREVDAAVEDDQQHADREDAEDGDMRGHGQEVADREVVRRQEREDDDDRRSARRRRGLPAAGGRGRNRRSETRGTGVADGGTGVGHGHGSELSSGQRPRLRRRRP